MIDLNGLGNFIKVQFLLQQLYIELKVLLIDYNEGNFGVNPAKYNKGRMEESPDPPFEKTYMNIINNNVINCGEEEEVEVEECELPVIDLKQLRGAEREACKKQIAGASQEWGFFQLINHGISGDVMRAEQVKMFSKPFQDKKTYKGLNFSDGTYRWGTPSATCLNQLSWSEAFHVQLTDIFHANSPPIDTLRSTMEQYARKVWEVAQELAEILAEEMSSTNSDESASGFFKEKCLPCSCSLRLNRYPPCPILYKKKQMMGIMPHTDSDFLTILQQDNVGGLQLLKDGNWIAVKPNPDALVINIGDLFQAWSNNVYKSVEHRVVANAVKERFSIAYFLCPSFDTVITRQNNSTYRSFSFGEYKKQVQEDVQIFGHKVGLPRFLIQTH